MFMPTLPPCRIFDVIGVNFDQMRENEMEHLKIEVAATALIVVDLQNGLLSRPLAPHDKGTILGNTVALADALSSRDGLVVRVKMDFLALPTTPVDVLSSMPKALPAAFSALAPEIEALHGSILVKRQWGSFHGTELDVVLRQQNITTVIICGLATNFGIESTVREAWQHRYEVVVAEDACSSLSAELHDFAITKIFPSISRVRRTATIIAALESRG